MATGTRTILPKVKKPANWVATDRFQWLWENCTRAEPNCWRCSTEILSGLLVPPWNRIHDEVLQRATEAGFTGVSTHAWLKHPMPLPTVNTHVDIMHWSGGTVGREPNWVWNQLAINLGTARNKGGRAIGILTHHLVHDDKAWFILEKLIDLFDGRSAWIAADDLLNDPPRTIELTSAHSFKHPGDNP